MAGRVGGADLREGEVLTRATRALLVALALVIFLVLAARDPRVPEPHESWTFQVDKSWSDGQHSLEPDPSWTFRPDPSWEARGE